MMTNVSSLTVQTFFFFNHKMEEVHCWEILGDESRLARGSEDSWAKANAAGQIAIAKIEREEYRLVKGK